MSNVYEVQLQVDENDIVVNVITLNDGQYCHGALISRGDKVELIRVRD